MTTKIRSFIEAETSNPLNTNGSSLLACFFCCLSYSDNVPDLLQDSGITLVFNGDCTAPNYAFVAVDKLNNCYLAVRGSLPPAWTWDSVTDWFVDDLNILESTNWQYTSQSGAWVADGSYDAFSALQTMSNQLSGIGQANIYDTLTQQNAVNIIITGHSLGGNMANLYASYFYYSMQSGGQGTSNIFLITFAAPSAGNQAFADAFDAQFTNQTSFHYEIDNDIIPKFPVYDDVYNLAQLYSPAPAASQICELDVCLSNTIHAFADLTLYLLGYAKPANGFVPLQSGLSPDYVQNTDDDWFAQAECQHAISNYASYLFIDKDIIISIKETSRYKSAFASV